MNTTGGSVPIASAHKCSPDNPEIPHSVSPVQFPSGDDCKMRRVSEMCPRLSSLVIRIAPDAHNAWNTTPATTINNNRR